jgi:ribosomal protein L40E
MEKVQGIHHCRDCGSLDIRYGHRWHPGVGTMMAIANIFTARAGFSLGTGLCGMLDYRDEYYCAKCGSTDLAPKEEPYDPHHKDEGCGCLGCLAMLVSAVFVYILFAMFMNYILTNF